MSGININVIAPTITTADTFQGGAGDDVYIVDDVGDVVVEAVLDGVVGGIVRVSTDSNGLQGNGDSVAPVFLADGTKVAFFSDNTLVAGDTNGTFDIFVKDLTSGSIQRVNTAADGSQANDYSQSPAFSADGTKVVFYSRASNLVADDTNGVADIFIKDLTSGAISRVSTAADGTQGNFASENGHVFSLDGTKVAFWSAASNLVTGDTNGTFDIFVKDLTSGSIQRVNTAADGSQANDYSQSPALSADGTKVVFYSRASNLVADDTNGVADIFIKDLTSGAISRVSTTADGTQAINDSSDVLIFSPDGTKLVFYSYASNLVADDTNGFADIFVKDLTTGAIQRISTAADGSQANGGSIDGAVFSADGTKIAFGSYASNLVANDTNGVTDVFIKDLTTGAINRVNTDANGAQANSYSDHPIFSADGTKVAFAGTASNLVANDTNGTYDIFIKNIASTLTDTGGIDTVQSSISYTLGQYLENLTLTGSDNINGTGNTLNNVITGNSGNNVLVGDAGNDTVAGGTGNDLIIGGRGNDTVYFNLGDGNDTIDNQSDDTNTTTDVLVFGQGIILSDLTFIRYSNSPDSTVLINGTTDSIVAKNYFSQPQYYNNIELKFADGTVITYQQLLHIGFVRQGDDTNNTFYGFLGDDTLIGGLGDDTLAGGFATDSYKLGLGNDTVIYRYNQDGGDYVFEDLTNQEINDGADDGVDTYKIFNTPINSLGQTIHFGIEANTESYPNLVMTIGDNNSTLGTQTTNDWQDAVPLGWQGIYIENFFTRNPQGSDNGTPVLTAASAHDVFVFYSDEGMTEISRMTGQEIYDTYFSPVPPVNHAPTLTSASAILTNGQENTAYTVTTTQLLQGFTDADGDLLSIANVSANHGTVTDNGNGTFTIAPTANYNGSISLSYQVSDGKGGLVDATQSFNLIKAVNVDTVGTTGGDMLHGGSGDDTFIVNHVRDVVFEEANGGIDTVQSTLSHILRDNVENLILVGDTDLSGTGNNANNNLTGNNGNNRLLAGDGNDTLSGGAGGDTLNGGAGADIMFGGTGNDTFTVENTDDTVTEFEGEGFDTVNSFISYTHPLTHNYLTLLNI